MDISNKDYVADGTENIIKQKTESGLNGSATSRRFHHIDAEQDKTNVVSSIFTKQDDNNLSNAGGDDDLMSQEQMPSEEKKEQEKQKQNEEPQDQPHPTSKKFAPDNIDEIKS